MTLRIQLAEWWQSQGAQTWEPDLAAMRVAGENEVHLFAARLGGYVIGIVRFVRHEDDRRIHARGNCQVKIRTSAADVIQTGKKDVLSVPFHANVFVHQQRQPATFHLILNEVRTYRHIVVAQDAVAR